MTLKTPTMGRADPFLMQLGTMIGGGVPTEIVQDGYLTIGHWSPEHDGWLIGTDFGAWELLEALEVPEYGVCDSIDQFDAKFGDILRNDMRLWCVFFVHVAKDPSNAGEGGGWRWHKWGTYVGEGEPTQEYLDDEEGFEDGVWTCHVYELRG